MEIDPIEFDPRERGWWSRFRYPLALVQTFRPCSWSQLDVFIWESEIFHTAMRERSTWLKDHSICCKMTYDHVEDLTIDRPRNYRIFTEFRCREGMEAYLQEWQNGTVSRIQPSDDQRLAVCNSSHALVDSNSAGRTNNSPN